MKNEKVQYLVRLAFLIAIILLLAYTPLGYLPIGPGLTVTILTVPVAIGAICMGPKAGSVLGFVFGLTSFLNAWQGKGGTTTVLFYLDPPLSILGVFLLCVGTRVLVGFLCGLIYKSLNKIGKQKHGGSVVKIALSSVSAPILNTILFLSTMLLLFSNQPTFAHITSFGAAWVYIWGVFVSNGILEAVTCGIIATAVSKALLVFLKKQ